MPSHPLILTAASGLEKEILVIRSNYKAPGLWLSLQWAYILLLFITGLIPGQYVPDLSSGISHFDKVLHFLSYLGLGLLFQQIIDRPPRVLLLRAIVIGLIIELLQTQVPGRTFESADILANTLGAFCGIILSARVCPQLFERLENFYFRS